MVSRHAHLPGATAAPHTCVYAGALALEAVAICNYVILGLLIHR